MVGHNSSVKFLAQGGDVEPQDRWIAAGGAYETRVLTVPAGTSTVQSTRRLTDEAEYGRWELARSVRFWGGARQATLRRKTIKVTSTL
jgi:hypothetical protein